MGIFALLLVSSQAAEWSTSSGQYCIERCQENDDGVYKCAVVDGDKKEFRPSMDHENSGRPNVHEDEEDEGFPTDYCTPTIKHLSTKTKRTMAAAMHRPCLLITDNEGGQGMRPGMGGKDEASLPGYKCEGSCHKVSNGHHHKCSINGHPTHSDFFCSQNIDLRREQLTSWNKLWCMGPCIKGENDDHYMCPTLFGMDRCSPTKDRSSQGEVCLTPCLVNTNHDNHHYQCQVDQEDPPTLHNCGFWYDDKAKTKALEYTADDKVCANPCSEEKLCLYVDWEEGDDLTVLTLNEDYCGGETGIDWTMVGGIIAAVVVAIILIAVVAMCLVKKPYQRANTSE